MVNPGGLRAELCYAATPRSGGFHGTILYAEANGVLPFVNNLWTITLTGAQFKTALEQQWQRDVERPDPAGRPYLQLGLSDNVTYTYDPTAPQGSHITSVTVERGAARSGPRRTGSAASRSCSQGGDNFREFANGTERARLRADRPGRLDRLPDGQHRPCRRTSPGTRVVVTGQPTTAARRRPRSRSTCRSWT